MASKDYLKLCEEAQKKKLKLIKSQEKQIKEIYNDMYLKVSKKLSKVNPNSLSKRYLEELKKALEKDIEVSNEKIKDVIKNNAKKSSELANKTQLDFFMSINKEHGLGMGTTFSDMFSKIPKEAMNEVLFGKAYKDRKGLSERIWLDTKKFNKDIDYIIAEGIANKKSTYEVAKDLEKYVNPKASKDWKWEKVYPNANKVVDYNAQRLARTSIQHAFQQAQKRSCNKNPYVEKIRWLSSNSSRTCELCNSRNNQLFNVNDVPLDHPNGLCTTIPEIDKSLEEIESELRAWIDGEVNPMLDKWFKKYGEEFAGAKNDIPKETPSKTSSNKEDKPKISKTKDNAINNIPTDKKGIIKFMQDNLGVKIGNVNNIDEKALRGCAEFTNDFLNKYPKLKEHPIYKNKFNITEFDGNVYADYKMSQIRLSVKSFKNYDALVNSVKRQHKTGWMITCNEGLEYKQLYVHEFGHFINDLIAMDDDKFFTEEKMANEFKKQLITEYKKTTKEKIKTSDIGKLVSDYALTNSCELFAEAFAEYHTNSNPRTFAKLFGDRLEKYLKKYK